LDDGWLRATAIRRQYRRGEVVFHEGDPAGALHLIERGHVAVQLTTPSGEIGTVDVLQPGDTFGEQALVDGVGERTATVLAIDRTETLAIDRASFERLRAERPGIDRFLVMVLTARLQATTRRLLDALYLPADERVARCVARLLAAFATGSATTIPLTQADLASMAGVTRSTMNRVLKQLEGDGVLVVKRGTLEVVDAGRLDRAAGAG